MVGPRLAASLGPLGALLEPTAGPLRALLHDGRQWQQARLRTSQLQCWEHRVREGRTVAACAVAI
eukprot:6592774-Pyramimonas_sp.AAC.1